ncbi:MAG: hypothetical protein CMH54_06645 [Myxococcales bacterium]|nr:hypothetical protein [Myxococcales bacterium]
MHVFGQVLLGLGFLASLGYAGTAFLGARFRRQNLLDASRYGLYALAGMFWGISLLLSYAFLTHDFSNTYVAAYSDRGMSNIYLLSAFWGGEKGALLLWVTSLTTFSAISVHTNRNKDPRWIGTTTGILLLCIAFFEMLMVLESNPFSTWLTYGGPADGQGMNPVLQNVTMMIHPPSLLTGYICFTIPFAYGLAALIVGKLDTEWIRVTRVWTIISWLFLSVGLILGGLWAYQEQGWGGYWMWDPVENAGLIPWFTATAFLHSVMIQERRGMLKRWNAILLCLTFLLTIFGTFLTRSQLIASIHAFADSKLPYYFLTYMFVIAAVSFLAIRKRWDALKSEHRIESFWSRESFFILNNVMLVACSFIVIYGTLFPKISDHSGFRRMVNNTVIDGYNSTIGQILPNMSQLTQSSDLGQDFFNAVIPPVALCLLFLSAAGPIIAWRRATITNFRKNFVGPLLWSILPTLITVAFFINRTYEQLTFKGLSSSEAWTALWAGHGMLEFYVYLTFYLCYFVIACVLMEYIRAIAIRRQNSGGSRLKHAFILTFKARRRFGGYIVHLGMVLCFFAFAGTAMKASFKNKMLHPGGTVTLHDYRATLARMDFDYQSEGRYLATRATVVVTQRNEPFNRQITRKFSRSLESKGIDRAVIRAKDGFAKLQVYLPDQNLKDRLLAAGLIKTEFDTNFIALEKDIRPDAEPPVFAMRYRYKHEKALELARLPDGRPAYMFYVRELKARMAQLESLGIEGRVDMSNPKVLHVDFKSLEHMQRFEAEVMPLAANLPGSYSIREGLSSYRVLIADNSENIIGKSSSSSAGATPANPEGNVGLPTLFASAEKTLDVLNPNIDWATGFRKENAVGLDLAKKLKKTSSFLNRLDYQALIIPVERFGAPSKATEQAWTELSRSIRRSSLPWIRVILVGSGANAAQTLLGNLGVRSYVAETAQEFEAQLRASAINITPVEIIPKGIGSVMAPEVRVYEKIGSSQSAETMTTEIAVESHLLWDVYLSMRPSPDYRGLSMDGFLNPLVSFLWLGAAVMVIGAIIALLPNWAVLFLWRRRRNDKTTGPLSSSGWSRIGVLPWLTLLAIGLLTFTHLAFANTQTDTPPAAPATIDAPKSRLEVISERMFCPDQQVGSWVVHPDRTLNDCPTAEGRRVRKIVQGILDENRAWDVNTNEGRFLTFERLIQIDRSTPGGGQIDTLLRVPQAKFSSIWNQTKCLCGCAHILMHCGAECGPAGLRWRPRFRQMLTAGYTTDDVRADYAKYYGSTSSQAVTKGEIDKHKKGTGPPIVRIILFLVVGLTAVVLVLTNVFGSSLAKKKPRKSKTSSPEHPVKEESDESELISELLDEIDDPLS